MEVKLESLIEKIKQEGVDKAEMTSKGIIEKAKSEADSIIAEAKKKADKLTADARNKADQFQKNAELAIQHAARDSRLLLHKEFTSLFDRVFKQEVAETLEPAFLKELIVKIVDGWIKSSSAKIDLNKKDLDQLERLLFSGVRKDLKKTITLKPSSGISHGFRIGLKGEDVYYDFSDESIAEMLSLFLNQRLIAILERKDG